MSQAPTHFDLNPVSYREVFAAFLKLGLTAFGGPTAHLGYFEYEFVSKRRWLTASDYIHTVSLSQLLPGPASSQVSFAIGYYKAGWLGALAAWFAFTAPSALFMILLGIGIFQLPESFQPHIQATIVGIQIAVAAIIFNAVLTMWKGLCKSILHKALAIVAAIYLIANTGAEAQFVVLATAGLVGLCQLVLIKPAKPAHLSAPALSVPLPTPQLGLTLFIIFAVLLCAALWLSHTQHQSWLTQGLAFYQSGALVFGGGHVVLPLLQSEFVATGALSSDAFVVGYGAAQMVPGPLFTFGGFVGSAMNWPLQGFAGGLLGLTLLFLPGCLLILAGLPFYQTLANSPIFNTTVAALSASVVGMLFATLTLSVGNIHWQAAVAATIAWLALNQLRLNPFWLVITSAVLSWAYHFTQ